MKTKTGNPEFRIRNPVGGRRTLRLPSGFWIVATGFFLLPAPGCADGPGRPSGYERSERALKDPMNYSPDIGKPDTSGGDFGHFDKDGFNKDASNVLNP
jgi:hypothetical protein